MHKGVNNIPKIKPLTNVENVISQLYDNPY